MVDHHSVERAWRVIHPGVYALAHAPLTRHQRWMAATLTTPDTVLSHSNAEHRRLLRALRNHDGVGAVRLMRTHLAGTEHIIAGLAP